MMPVDPPLQHAIEQLLYEWARSIDEGRYEDLLGLLTEDGEYKVASRFNADRGLPLAIIHTRTRAQLKDRITSLRVANIYETHHYRHLVSGVQVVGASERGHEVRSNYTVIRTMEHDGSMTVFSAGQYRDEVVFLGDTPRLRRRHVVFDSRAIDTLLVIPL